MSQMFTLSTTGADGKPVDLQVTAEQLAAAGIKVVPEGTVVMEKSAVEALEGKITNLNDTVAALAESNKVAVQASRTIELTATLDKLSKGGFIDKKTREWAVKTFGESIDLTSFRDWAALQTHPIIQLGKEHGSGVDDDGGDTKQAGKQLLELANELVKTKNLSVREATIEASRQRPELAEAYRETMAEVAR